MCEREFEKERKKLRQTDRQMYMYVRTYTYRHKHITDDEDYEILRHPHCIVIIRNFLAYTVLRDPCADATTCTLTAQV
jgi:hypothetical protein